MSDRGGTRETSLSGPTYDESEWPILRVTMPPLSLSDAAFQAHLDAGSERYTRGQPFCMINWLAQPAYRFLAFGDLLEARTWLLQVLEHHRTAVRSP